LHEDAYYPEKAATVSSVSVSSCSKRGHACLSLRFCPIYNSQSGYAQSYKPLSFEVSDSALTKLKINYLIVMRANGKF